MNRSFIEDNEFLKKISNFLINKRYISGKNNAIKIEGIATGCEYNIGGDNNVVEIAKGCRLINCKFIIKGSNHKVKIDEECQLRELTIWLENEHNTIIVGKNTTINGKTEISAVGRDSRVEVKSDCMLSSNICITNTDSHSILDMKGNRINPERNVMIGNHVWIGMNVTILKGSVINDNVVIGANSVVTASMEKSESNCVLVGNPATIVKKNVTWMRERI